jgi:hypothetical protein
MDDRKPMVADPNNLPTLEALRESNLVFGPSPALFPPAEHCVATEEESVGAYYQALEHDRPPSGRHPLAHIGGALENESRLAREWLRRVQTRHYTLSTDPMWKDRFQVGSPAEVVASSRPARTYDNRPTVTLILLALVVIIAALIRARVL